MALLLVTLALWGPAVGSQAPERAPAILIKPESPGVRGEAAPLAKILTTFLVRAHSERHAPTWVDFLARFGIDPSWPSAELLGRAALEIETEQRDRAAAASRSTARPGRRPPTPADDWRDEETGRRFAEVLNALIDDGFDLPLPTFIRAIEDNVRPYTTYYSDLTATESARESELFWRGAESLRPGLREELGR